MTKIQLIKKLEKINDNTEIILSSDSEGNNFSRIGEIYDEKGLKYIDDEGGNFFNW